MALCAILSLFLCQGLVVCKKKEISWRMEGNFSRMYEFACGEP